MPGPLFHHIARFVVSLALLAMAPTVAADGQPAAGAAEAPAVSAVRAFLLERAGGLGDSVAVEVRAPSAHLPPCVAPEVFMPGRGQKPLVVAAQDQHPALVAHLTHGDDAFAGVQRRWIDSWGGEAGGGEPAAPDHDRDPASHTPRDREVHRHRLEAQTGGDLCGRGRFGDRGARI